MPSRNPYQLSLFEKAVAPKAKAVLTLRESAETLGAANLMSEMLGLTYEETTEMIRKGGGIYEVIRSSEYVLQGLPHMTEWRARLIKLMNRWGQLLNQITMDDRPQICMPVDAANLLMAEMRLLEREELWVIGLDTKHYVKAIETVYKGSLNCASVRISEVLRMPMSLCCASAVIAHNHPSGDPTPSPEDVRMTEIVVEAGSLLNIEIIDHIVIGHNRFVSMKERGLGFK